MGRGKRNPGCLCCVSCDIVLDDYSTDTIANYTQVSGTWAISGGYLSSSVDGVIIHDTTDPDTHKHSVDVDVKLINAADRARIIVNYSDASNYLYAEWESNGTCGILSLWEMKAGTRTEIFPTGYTSYPQWEGFALNVNTTLRVHFDGTNLGAEVIDTTTGELWMVWLATPDTPADGNQMGLENVGDTQYDNLFFRNHGPGCPVVRWNCLLHADNFDRADNATDWGCEWEVKAGDAEIKNNKGELLASDSILLSKGVSKHLTNDGINPQASVHSTKVGAQLRVLVHDGANFYYAQLQYFFSYTELSIYYYDGTHNLLAGPTTDYSGGAGTEYFLKLCVVPFNDGAQLILIANATTEDTTSLNTTYTPPTTGLVSPGVGCGIGSEISGEVTINNYEATRSSEDDTMSGCPDCVDTVTCDGACIDNLSPPFFLLEFSGFLGTQKACCTENNVSLVLAHDPDHVLAPCVWSVEISGDNLPCDLIPPSQVVGECWMRLDYDAYLDATEIYISKTVSVATFFGMPVPNNTTWRKSFPGQLDCRNLDELLVDVLNHCFDCCEGIRTSSSIKITSLDA